MLHKPHKPTVHEHGIHGYEKTDVAGKPLFWNFVILTVILLACIAVAFWVFLRGERGISRHSVPVLPVAEGRNLPPLPRLQERPAVDIEALRERDKALTTEYKWVDQVAGIVQIPVDQALEIIAEQGLPHGRDAHIPGQGLPNAAGSPNPTVPVVPVPVTPSAPAEVTTVESPAAEAPDAEATEEPQTETVAPSAL